MTLTPQCEDDADIRPTCKLSCSDGHQACAAVRSDLNSCLLQYEVPGAQEAARNAMPLGRLNATAADAAALSRHMGEEPTLHRSDALVQEMLAWFKAEFFTWVRPPTEVWHASAASTAVLDALTPVHCPAVVLCCSQCCVTALAWHMSGIPTQPSCSRIRVGIMQHR
jgi:hypothetical protein